MKLFSRIFGEGKPIIILHGLFGMSDNWNTLAKKFSKDFCVHVVDLRNHGYSPHSPHFNYKLLSEDILEYINQQGLFKPVIIGHSLGGKITMKLVATQSSIVEKIVIVDISPRNYDIMFHQNILKILNAIDLSKHFSRQEIDHNLSNDITDKNIRSFLLKNLYRNENKLFAWKFNIDSLLNNLHNINEDFIIGKSIDIPALFLKGERSNYITVKDENLIKNHFSQAIIKKINHAGHWVHAENPDQFYLEVSSFINL